MARKKLYYRKETDNKLRWDGEAGGVPFELYVPKWRVPSPVPSIVEVELRVASGSAADSNPVTQKMVLRDPGLREQTISAVLEKCSGHTKTIRYDPVDAEKAEIGDVYVPFCLTFGGVQRLSVTVSWRAPG